MNAIKNRVINRNCKISPHAHYNMPPYICPNLSGEVHASLGNILLLQAAAMTAFFLNNVWIVGMFRAGGDNLFTMNMILLTTWVIALPAV
ncbi:hypothetical protein [Paenibacillus sp. JNUCC31]|uniref:hypothetical protein n=1 Tax=Paenibacillus sp. JNUCC-31 TaxID=2777983 RepID=UPI001E31310B|nr:hypothetical protein [Paenibacillus sp. JNUCC-31]